MNSFIAVIGPTASGKSDLAVAIARFIRAEYPAITPYIISADSRQVYRGLDIGTGKITKREMKNVPHFMLDVASPRRQYSVADYQRDAFKLLRVWEQSHKCILPIIVGGSGQYIDAVLVNALFPMVKPNQKLRHELERLSTDELFKRLLHGDPRRAHTIDQRNRRRLIRALEIITATRRPIPPLRVSQSAHVLKIGISLLKDTLSERIHTRLLARLRSGMVREVQRIHENSVSWKRLDELGLEYRYISRFLRGSLSKEEMVQQLEHEINAYAKRQMTWFKRDKKTHWILRVPRQEDWRPRIEEFLTEKECAQELS